MYQKNKRGEEKIEKIKKKIESQIMKTLIIIVKIINDKRIKSIVKIFIKKSKLILRELKKLLKF